MEKRNRFAILLALVMALSMTACSAAEDTATTAPAETVSVETAAPETTAATEAVVQEAPTPKPWVRNLLMADSPSSSENADTYTVFGSELTRGEVRTITFLDTVADAPEDAWDFSERQNGAVLGWATSQNDGYDLYIAGEGGVQAPENCGFLFCGFINATTIDFNSAFHTASVTDMSSMFYNCSGLTELDVSSFDTSAVTTMNAMFQGCSNLTELNVDGFVTSSVTVTSSMFALCSNLTALNVSHFDTSKVTHMNGMFYNCSSLNELDVSNFDTSSAIVMAVMFCGCSSLTNLDVSNFDTSNVLYYNNFMDGTGWESLFE